MCPADYNDAMQTDSDCMNDPDYTQEGQNAPPSPASSQLSGVGPSSASRRRQRQNNKQGRQDSFDDANNELNAKRNRITTPTREEDDDEISMPEPKKPRKSRRHTPSVVWEHVP